MSNIFVKLPTGDVEIEHVREMYVELNVTKFEHTFWKPRPALIDKTSKSSQLYHGQKFDPFYFDLVEDGWTHVHCEICFSMLSNHDSNFETGYFNGGVWICSSCYEIVLSTKDIEKRLSELPQYSK